LKKVIIIIFTILLLSSCNQVKVHHNKELEKAIISITNEEGTGEIDLSEVTDFTWDKAFIIKPYTTNEAVRERVGGKVPSNMESRDDVNAIIFIEEDKPVQYVEITRYVDFVVDDETKPIWPEDSIVKFEKTF
jgi:hypothetical protein